MAESIGYKLDRLPTFPRTLLDFKHYDGWKCLTVIALFLTSTYLAMGLIGYSLDHNPWLYRMIFGNQVQEVIKNNHWWDIFAFWTKSIGDTRKEILSAADVLFRGLIFLCSYCLTWAAFDSKNVEGYIMGFFNMVLGAVYILSPMDLVPDILPVVGSIDDAVFSAGMFTLGAYIFNQGALREQKTRTILEMVRHDKKLDYRNLEKALQLMLEDRGVHIEFTDEDSSDPS